MAISVSSRRWGGDCHRDTAVYSRIEYVSLTRTLRERCVATAVVSGAAETRGARDAAPGRREMLRGLGLAARGPRAASWSGGEGEPETRRKCSTENACSLVFAARGSVHAQV